MSEEEAEALCDAYRSLRSRIHQLALQEVKGVVDDAEYAREREIVCQAWQKWLESFRPKLAIPALMIKKILLRAT